DDQRRCGGLGRLPKTEEKCRAVRCRERVRAVGAAGRRRRHAPVADILAAIFRLGDHTLPPASSADAATCKSTGEGRTRMCAHVLLPLRTSGSPAAYSRIWRLMLRSALCGLR